jgi:hypothetical protein
VARSVVAALIPLVVAGCASRGGIERLRPAEDAYVYRGSSPSWVISVDPRVIIFDDGSTRIVERAVAPVLQQGRAIIRTPRLAVTSISGRCTLGGNEALYSEIVTVVADGRNLTGCGGKSLVGGSLLGSHWRLTAVNGTKLAAGSGSMTFGQGTFTAVLPCRTLGGRYAETGVIVSFGQISASAERCQATELEANAVGLLNGLVTVDWSSATQLTLSSNSTKITLER